MLKRRREEGGRREEEEGRREDESIFREERGREEGWIEVEREEGWRKSGGKREGGWRKEGGLRREEGGGRRMEDGWRAGLVVLGRRVMAMTESKVIREDKEFLRMMGVYRIDEEESEIEKNVKE